MENQNINSTRPQFPAGINVFVIRDGKLLLGKRKSSYHDSEWGLPGGHLEHGEMMMEAATRELKEETNLDAGSMTFVIAENDPRDDGNHYVHFGFRAEDVKGEVVNTEPDKCYSWEWFTLDALPEPLFIGHKKLIEGFVQGKLFHE
ncbi:MAG: 8-oxo-dGTP diphosphatase [Parcubacteria bacterium C7867-008]|nr:MAG: 8-oxo-dGTP diphosphatase [Parcubacteria bacterium C7867-008]